MAFPDVESLLDDFNRTNGGPGANWQAVAGHGNGAITTNAMTFAADDSATLYLPLSYADGVVIGDAVGVSGGTEGGVIWRGKTDGSAGYVWTRSGSFNQVFRLDNNGAVGSSFTRSWAAGNRMGVKSVGSTFDLYRWDGTSWALVATRSDATFAGAGHPGLWGDNSGSNRWDNLWGGSLDPPPADVPNCKVKSGGVLIDAVMKAKAGGVLVPARPLTVGASPQDSFNGWANGLPDPPWAPYNSDSPFNKLLPASPIVHPASATVMANFWAMLAADSGSTKPGNLFTKQATTSDYSHPQWVARSTDPLYTLVTGGDLSNVQFRCNPNAQPAGGTDGHMYVITPDGWEYDLYQATINHTTHVITAAISYRQRYDGLGIVTPAMVAPPNNHQGLGGTTASYFGQHAGIIRGPEIYAAHFGDPETAINHAIFMVGKALSNDTNYGYGTVAPGANGRGGAGSSIWPAFKGDAIPATWGWADVDLPPMGARLFLDMTAGEINALPAQKWEKAILHALRKYGGYFGDTGGPGLGFMFESGRQYTLNGRTNPFETVAVALGLTDNQPFGYGFFFHNSTPWTTKLKCTLS